MVERRHDPGRERRRAAALDQLDQRMQVDRALARELLGQGRPETRLMQAGPPPCDGVVASSAGRRLAAGPKVSSGSEIHALLAPSGEHFLPPTRKGADHSAPLPVRLSLLLAALDGSDARDERVIRPVVTPVESPGARREVG
jgi:hypothetical protein